MGLIVDLIGSGESAADLDTLQLDGLSIGLNEAGLRKPCDAWFTLDVPYAAGVIERVRDRHPPEGIHVCGRSAQREKLPYSVTWWARLYKHNPVMLPRQLSSGAALDLGCTGFVALNLAAQLGADTVRLWGFDFHDDYRYFYQAEPHPRAHVARVRDLFASVAPWYAAQGIRIINMNPASSIKAFPYG